VARATTFECPNCGEAKRLQGARRDEVVEIRCLACDHEWVHDPWGCPTCAGRMHPERRPLLQKARGTQQSIIGYRIEKVCPRCDPPEDRDSKGWMSATMDP
jgi:predicted RNA-binding Zn-ribbon protein involved in translation (DUF1610 family)